MMTVRTATSAEPITYYYTQADELWSIRPARRCDISRAAPGHAGSYTYVKEGDRMIVTKVTLQKPITYYEKTERLRRPRIP